MSDIHLTNNGEKIIGLDPVRKLERALDYALSAHGDATQIVFTGDLTHNGSKEEYLNLKTLIQGIDIPITYMMGNHDRRDAFTEIFPSVSLDDNGFLQSSITYDNHKLVYFGIRFIFQIREKTEAKDFYALKD